MAQTVIIDNKTYKANIESNPRLILTPKLSVNGGFEYDGNHTWEPLKTVFINKYIKPENGLYENIIIIGESTFKLSNCYLNLDEQVITFDNCILLEDFK